MSDAVTLVAAAFGAFLGTGSAYLLEQNRRRQERDEARYGLLIETQLALGMQLNTLVNIQQHLDEHRDKSDRHMWLLPLHMALTDLRVNLSSLGFVAELDDVDILQDVYLGQQAYLTAALGLDDVNHAIQVYRFEGGQPLGPVDEQSGEALAVFDAGEIKILSDLVDGLFDSVDGGIGSLLDASKAVAGVIRRLFPSRKVLSFDLKAQPSTDASG